ncbi:hypothetical protein BV900_17100 [Agrobacterium tumefaciens]|nr:hypothetical protein BV900_17100 [Agrobacterium tumefaciens]
MEVVHAGGYLAGQLQAVGTFLRGCDQRRCCPILREYLGLFDQLGPEVKQALGMTEAHRIEISGVLAQKDQELENVQFEDGFTGLLQLLRELANEWKESHPDGYNSRGETYYSSESTGRSVIL